MLLHRKVIFLLKQLPRIPSTGTTTRALIAFRARFLCISSSSKLGVYVPNLLLQSSCCASRAQVVSHTRFNRTYARAAQQLLSLIYYCWICIKIAQVLSHTHFNAFPHFSAEAAAQRMHLVYYCLVPNLLLLHL